MAEVTGTPHPEGGTPPPEIEPATDLADLRAVADALVAHWVELRESDRLRMVLDIDRRVQTLTELERFGPSVDPLLLVDIHSLTPRETEILQALVDGASTSSIAASLGVTIATVRSHVKRILNKLGVHSRTEAVCLVLRNHVALHSNGQSEGDEEAANGGANGRSANESA